MIENTFQILEGIGEKRERMLWQGGILSWEGFLSSEPPEFISGQRKAYYDEALREASERLAAGDAEHFRTRLPMREHWRLFERLKGKAVCLDIETSGLSPADGGYTTVVGLYDGSEYRALVRGRDLTAESLMDAVSGYSYIITFYGSAFDLPFLERTLPGFRLRLPHFDLCFGLKRVGLRGGLKRIEQTLGLARPASVQGMDGYAAVMLWNRAMAGSTEAMDLLIEYNREDTVHLMWLAEYAYGKLVESTGFGALAKAAAA